MTDIFRGPSEAPKNDDNLSAVEIIGRCGTCSTVGNIEYKNHLIPASDIDKILAYKSVKCFCPTCGKVTEFLPIEVKKYPDVPLLSTVQKQRTIAGNGKIVLP